MSLLKQELQLHYELGRKHAKQSLIMWFIIGLLTGALSCFLYWLYLASLS